MIPFSVCLLSVFCLTLFTTWLLLAIAPRLGLIQNPTSRSLHIEATPHGGGISVVLVTTVTGLWMAQGDDLLTLILYLSFLAALIGLADDIRPVSAGLRLVGQALIMGFLLHSIGPMPSFGVIDGFALMTLLFLAGLWWLNLFNFMDGADGLAAVQCIFMLVSSGALIALFTPDASSHPVFFFILVLTSAIAGFLVLNFPPAKIFLGDVGSLWVGFVLFSLALSTTQAGWLTYQVWLILGSAFISDATLTLCARLIKGRNFFRAHRSHGYQLLIIWFTDKFSTIESMSVRREKSHRRLILLFLGINILWLAPIAFATVIWPSLSWYLVLVAYLPIVMTFWRSGAGGRNCG